MCSHDLFLRWHLIPQAVTEERVLCLAVQRLMGVEQTTATMSRDHQEVGKLTGEYRAFRIPFMEQEELIH
jgi:hypothetical protein